jgi:CRP-like cAMP-binding protein
MGQGRYLPIEENKIIFLHDEPGDFIVHIQEGSVKPTVLSERGKEAVVVILGTGDFCGEGMLGWSGPSHGDGRSDRGMQNHSTGGHLEK